ncbi:MAG: deoxyribose-phosphate aldolase [Candidatus Dormibacteraeota bacterium]|nr:deoxyribose-phosphate aldolase [Candidatus Dormibacteraeota bacterium]
MIPPPGGLAMDAGLPSTPAALAAYIDQTNLDLGCTRSEIRAFVQTAVDQRFKAVCILPNMVPTARTVVRGSAVKVATVVSFPLGADTPTVKAAEARTVADMGADEVDMVIDIGRARAGEYTAIREEVAGVRGALPVGVVLKVIIEMPLLDAEESVDAALAAERGGADLIQTSTGFKGLSLRPTVASDIELLRSMLKPETGVKASGGIRTTEDALGVIAAGADRIGSSRGLAILDGLRTPDSGQRPGSAGPLGTYGPVISPADAAGDPVSCLASGLGWGRTPRT